MGGGGRGGGGQSQARNVDTYMALFLASVPPPDPGARFRKLNGFFFFSPSPYFREKVVYFLA